MDATIESDRRAAWLHERRAGIGGSDAAAACGIDPYRDRLTLWAEKVGLAEPQDLTGNEAVEAGIALERAIGEWYGRRFGRAITLGEPFRILRSERWPWMTCTLDATEVVDGETRVVQIKNTSHPADAWEEAVPVQYEVQLAHEMLVAGVTRGTLVALHRGQQLRAYERTLLPRLADMIVEREQEFWQLVQSETPPDAGPRSADTVKAMFPRSTIGDLVALPPHADDLDAELEQIREQMSMLEDRKSAIESQLKLWIGDHEGGVTAQGVRFSWKGSEVTYKPQDARTVYQRRFLRSKAK